MGREIVLLENEEIKQILKIKVVEEQKRKRKFSFQLEFFVASHGQDSMVIG